MRGKRKQRAQVDVLCLALGTCPAATSNICAVSAFPRDDTPHVPNEQLGEEKVLHIIENLTSLIKQVFPGRT